MLYASDFRALGHSVVAIEDNPEDIPDLIAEFLIRSVEKRLRQPLTQGYRQKTTRMSRVRGKIDILATESQQLLMRGQVACVFDDLTLNTPRNCYVRSALQLLARIINKQELQIQCKYWANEMVIRGVIEKKPSERQINAERFGRHDSHDQPMLHAAKLAFQLALPTEGLGEHSFLTPDREEKWIYKLFEKAVAGFYRINLPKQTWRVTPGKRLKWQTTRSSAGIDAVLPSMKTDIVLDELTQKRRIIIDTKFTSVLRKGQYRKETLSSGYLYQIYAYLFSQKGCGDFEENSQGVLLHPSIGKAFDESVVIQGHPIRFMTIDLAGSTLEWKNGLLSVLEP